MPDWLLDLGGEARDRALPRDPRSALERAAEAAVADRVAGARLPPSKMPPSSATGNSRPSRSTHRRKPGRAKRILGSSESRGLRKWAGWDGLRSASIFREGTGEMRFSRKPCAPCVQRAAMAEAARSAAEGLDESHERLGDHGSSGAPRPPRSREPPRTCRVSAGADRERRVD